MYPLKNGLLHIEAAHSILFGSAISIHLENSCFMFIWSLQAKVKRQFVSRSGSLEKNLPVEHLRWEGMDIDIVEYAAYLSTYFLPDEAVPPVPSITFVDRSE